MMRRSSSTTATTGLRRAISRGSRSPGVSYRYLQFLSNPHQIGERGSLHLLHDATAMNLKRDLADSEFRGSLFVQEPTDHQRKYFPFAGREAEEALPQGGEVSAFPTCFPIEGDSSVDRCEQIRLAEWLGQEIDGTMLHRAHGRRNVAVPGDEDDGRMIFIGDLFLKIQSVDVGKLNVQNQAGG